MVNWIFSLIFLLTAQNLWAKEIVLKAGESKKILSHSKAWVEKSKIVRLQESPHGYNIKGLRPGSSLVRLGKETYDVVVLSPAQETAYGLLDSVIHKTLNLDLKISDGKVRVQGTLLRWIDWETLYRVCQDRNCDYVMSVHMAPSLEKLAKKKITAIFQSNGLAPQNLMFDREIQAQVLGKGENSGRVSKVLKSMGIQVIASSSNLDLEPLIKVQITIAEVRKDESLKYGIQWAPSYSAQLLPIYPANSESKEMTLQALETAGIAKVLASPNILCRSGKEASFFAGGEFPIKILNYKIQDVIWKKYGIILNVKPKADFSGKMSISIETEVSSLDTSRTVDGAPGLYSNKIQTHFDLTESRTIALSGLIKSEQGEASQGLPGLSRIPILGALFSSKDFRENRTELVVFVRPEVISPGSLEAKQ